MKIKYNLKNNNQGKGPRHNELMKKLFESHPAKDWPNRMVLYSVLATTKSLLEVASPEDSFFGHSAVDSIKVIDSAILYFHDPEKNDYPEDLVSLFAPTGALQELSMSNGWDKVYLKLSESFDKTIIELKNEI